MKGSLPKLIRQCKCIKQCEAEVENSRQQGALVVPLSVDAPCRYGQVCQQLTSVSTPACRRELASRIEFSLAVFPEHALSKRLTHYVGPKKFLGWLAVWCKLEKDGRLVARERTILNDKVEGKVHETALAAMVTRDVTVHQLLLAERDQLVRVDLVDALNRSCRGKGPAGAALQQVGKQLLS